MREGRSIAEEGSVAKTAVEPIAELRRALRAATAAEREDAVTAGVLDRTARAVDAAAAPLVERIYRPLLRYCDRLVRDSTILRGRIDGIDLAQDAWGKMIGYLRESTGDRVQDEAHFFRLLRFAAQTRFLDLLDRYRAGAIVLLDTVELDAPSTSHDGAGEPGLSAEERIADTASRGEMHAGAFPFGSDDQLLERIEWLFTDEAAFRRIGLRPMRRRIGNYRALVLYELGKYLVEEVGDSVGADSDATVRLLRAFADSVGIEAAFWLPVERAARTASLSAVLAAANEAFGVRLKAGNRMSVLRYELKGCLYA